MGATHITWGKHFKVSRYVLQLICRGRIWNLWWPLICHFIVLFECSGGVENVLKEWTPICSLSKTTKLILLDSLLQEVCINSWRRWVARLRVRSAWVSINVSHKPSLFRAKESPLNLDQSSSNNKPFWHTLIDWIVRARIIEFVNL